MNDYIELRRIILIALHRWWLLLLVSGGALFAGFFISQSMPKVYEASATVMVGRFTQSTELNRDDIQVSDVLARNYADLVKRQPVLNAVVENLGLDYDWRALRSNVSVELVENTNLLEIIVEADSPEEARVIADEISLQLIMLSPDGSPDLSAQQDDKLVRQQIDSLQSMIESGQERYIAMQQELAEETSADQYNQKLLELNTLGRLIADWQTNYTQLVIYLENSKSQNYLSIVEPAQANPSPARPRILLNTIISGAAGFIVIFGIVLVYEFSNEKIRSLNELVKVFGLIPLGMVITDSKRKPKEIMVNPDVISPETESYRVIRSNIELTADKSIRSLLITSPESGSGKSVMTINLGIVMAQAGLRTIIVDGDFRKPSLHKFFDVEPQGGLIELLSVNGKDPDDFIKNTDIEGLRLITSGDMYSNVIKPMGTQDVRNLLNKLTKEADIVIFDSPPIVDYADGLTLSSQVDGVVLVVNAGKTKNSQVRSAVSSLNLVRANVLGTVINHIKSRGLLGFLSSPTTISPVQMPIPAHQNRLGHSEIPIKHLLPEALIDPVELKEIRDKAIMLMGMSGSLNSSDIAGINLDEVKFHKEGIVVLVPRSQADPDSGYRHVRIPYRSNPDACPVLALEHWIDKAAIDAGLIFRQLRKGGIVTDNPLSSRTIDILLKKFDEERHLVLEDGSGSTSVHTTGRIGQGTVYNGYNNPVIPQPDGVLHRFRLFISNLDTHFERFINRSISSIKERLP